MIVEDQTEVEAFLSDPATHGGAAVERIDTHGAVVFLAGDRAYKLKRAVRFDYMDYATASRRRAMCEAEIALNRRTAPQIYRTVTAVARAADGTLSLGGPGEPVDWVVEMSRFDQETLFDRLAGRDALTLTHMDELAKEVADFHAAAEVRPDSGGAKAMQGVLAINAAGVASFKSSVFDPGKTDDLIALSDAALTQHAGLLDRRGQEGFVRRLHGDLHLRNICLIGGRPVIFDAIEFNDRLAVCDVWYDFAFLLMDLIHRGLKRHANRVFNDYLWHTGDVAGLALLPFFLSCRAAVRAHVGATAAQSQTDPDAADAMRAEARAYLDQAIAFLQPPPPRLVAIGGVSGTGKSTLARGLAPSLGRPPGAVHLRSDLIRKRLMGKAALDRLGPEAYTPDVSKRVYESMFVQTARIAATGHSVIADAVFLRADERKAMAAAARACGVQFNALWLQAPEEVLMRRVADRRGDASDADTGVLRRQLAIDPGPVLWPVVDAASDAESVWREAGRVLRIPV